MSIGATPGPIPTDPTPEPAPDAANAAAPATIGSPQVATASGAFDHFAVTKATLLATRILLPKNKQKLWNQIIADAKK